MSTRLVGGTFGYPGVELGRRLYPIRRWDIETGHGKLPFWGIDFSEPEAERDLDLPRWRKSRLARLLRHEK